MYWLQWSAPQLVLKQFRVRSSPSRESPVVEITGRRSGLVAFILSMIGLDPTVSLTVTSTEVRQRAASMSGETVDILPLRQIASVHASMTSPIIILIMGILALLPGLLAVAVAEGEPEGFMALFPAVVLIVTYFVTGKKFSLAFITSAGGGVAIGFKPKTPSGQKLDLDRLNQVAEAVRDLISQASGGGGMVAAAPAGGSGHAFSLDDEESIPAVEFVDDGDSFSPPPPPPPARGRSAAGSANPFDFDAPHASAVDPEEDAKQMFQRGADLYKAGRKAEAIAAWEEVVRVYPDTQAGRAAARNLDKMRK